MSISSLKSLLLLNSIYLNSIRKQHSASGENGRVDKVAAQSPPVTNSGPTASASATKPLFQPHSLTNTTSVS